MSYRVLCHASIDNQFNCMEPLLGAFDGNYVALTHYVSQVF